MICTDARVVTFSNGDALLSIATFKDGKYQGCTLVMGKSWRIGAKIEQAKRDAGCVGDFQPQCRPDTRPSG